jgi:hypothetical protein
MTSSRPAWRDLLATLILLKRHYTFNVTDQSEPVASVAYAGPPAVICCVHNTKLSPGATIVPTQFNIDE